MVIEPAPVLKPVASPVIRAAADAVVAAVAAVGAVDCRAAAAAAVVGAEAAAASASAATVAGRAAARAVRGARASAAGTPGVSSGSAAPPPPPPPPPALRITVLPSLTLESPPPPPPPQPPDGRAARGAATGAACASCAARAIRSAAPVAALLAGEEGVVVAGRDRDGHAGDLLAAVACAPRLGAHAAAAAACPVDREGRGRHAGRSRPRAGRAGGRARVDHVGHRRAGQTEAATTETSRPTASALTNTDQRRSIDITVAAFRANGRNITYKACALRAAPAHRSIDLLGRPSERDREAAGQGFEPQLPDPESGVLPLDDPATGRRAV